jgi:hypothetical protein
VGVSNPLNYQFPRHNPERDSWRDFLILIAVILTPLLVFAAAMLVLSFFSPN